MQLVESYPRVARRVEDLMQRPIQSLSKGLMQRANGLIQRPNGPKKDEPDGINKRVPDAIQYGPNEFSG